MLWVAMKTTLNMRMACLNLPKLRTFYHKRIAVHGPLGPSELIFGPQAGTKTFSRALGVQWDAIKAVGIKYPY